jgi:hypothetical protein
MWGRVALVRTDGSEEQIALIIKVIKIGELGTTLAATSNPSRLRRNFYTQAMSEKLHMQPHTIQNNVE